MRINIVRNLCVAVWCFGLSSVFAAPVIPIAPGTSWRYNMTEEVGKGFSLSNLKADADGKIRLPVLYRVEGTENVDGKDLLKFEMHRAGAITNTDLLSVDDHGITCWARINLDGELVKFNPPQTMIAFPLKKGAAWDFNGQAGELKVQQHYDCAGRRRNRRARWKISRLPDSWRANDAEPNDNRSLVRTRRWNCKRRYDDAGRKRRFAPAHFA